MKIDKRAEIARYIGMPISVIDKLEEVNVINKNSINRALVNILFDEYKEKYTSVLEACRMIASHLNISQHTVEAFVYNNRNKKKYHCSVCGDEISSYRWYQKNKKCKNC